MAVAYRSVGVDFDALFAPDIMGDGPSVAAMRSGGTPLRYAAIGYGTKRADVGYRVGGVDVSNLWAAAGTAVYSIPGLNGKSLLAADSSLTGQTTMAASVAVSFATAGTWSVSGSTSRGAVTQPAPVSGTWLPAGESASDYDIRYRVTSLSGSASVSNGAPDFQPLSSGWSISLIIPVQPANNANTESGVATVEIALRKRATGATRLATVTMRVSVQGWQ